MSTAAVDSLVVARAGVADVADLAPLVVASRQFDEQCEDLPVAARLVKERLARDEAVVFLARAGDEGRPIGFTLLYHARSTVALGHTSLETGVDNLAAQRLYAAIGMVRDTSLHRYELTL